MNDWFVALWDVIGFVVLSTRIWVGVQVFISPLPDRGAGTGS